jgi:hypothetical protein
LGDLLEQLVAAIQQGDSEEIFRIAQSMVLPDYHRWFMQVFGTSSGANVVELNVKSMKRPTPTISDSLRGVVQEGRTNIRVKRFEPTDDSLPEWYVRPLVKAMQNATALYQAEIYQEKELPGSWEFPD